MEFEDRVVDIELIPNDGHNGPPAGTLEVFATFDDGRCVDVGTIEQSPDGGWVTEWGRDEKPFPTQRAAAMDLATGVLEAESRRV